MRKNPSTRPERRAAPEAGAISLEVLSQAARLVARMSALANGAALHAVHATIREGVDEAVAKSARRRFRDSLDEFARIAAALRAGDDGLGVPEDAAERLGPAIWPDVSETQSLNAFVSHGYFVDAIIAGPGPVDQKEALALADIAGASLSEILDQALERTRVLQEAVTRARDAGAEDSKALVGETLRDLKDLTLRIQLISVNASVEAARAGSAGRGFGVIAHEITSLSTAAETAVDKIVRGVSAVA